MVVSTTGNSVSGDHPAADKPSFAVTTTTNGKLLNTIRQRLVTVACWRLEHAVFAFDSSVIGPESEPEIADLATVVRSNPGAPLAIFGHADPIGDDAYNKELAGRRARSLYALLVRDAAVWEELFSKPFKGDAWGLRSTQMMLARLRRGDGTPFYDGELDGESGPRTERAVRDFQSGQSLRADGHPGRATRARLYPLYMESITGGFSLPKGAFLDRGEDPKLRRACQGCGEFNPVKLLEARAQQKKDATRDARNAPNRRVNVFLFRPGTTVSASEWPCPAATEGPSRCRAQFWPDGETRREPGATEREYRTDRRTMACRFYDRFARVSPCEGILPAVGRFESIPAAEPDASEAQPEGGVDESNNGAQRAPPVEELE